MIINDLILELDDDNKVVDCIVNDQSLDKRRLKFEGKLLDLDYVKKKGLYELFNMTYYYEINILKGVSYVFFSKQVIESVMTKQALETIDVGIQIYNKQGYNLYLNQVSEQMSGIEKEDFVGTHLVDLYNLDEDFSTVLTTIRTGRPTMDRCDYFETRDHKALVTINSGFPTYYEDELIGVVLTENSIDTINKQAHKKLYLNEYLQSKHTSFEKSKYFQFKDIIYQSKSMEKTINVAKKVSMTSSSILIYGDTGTGKELLAQSIHSFSYGNDRPFIAVNCAAIPESLAESLFFGVVKGAYTGSENSEGFFSQANGGTLFLDEVNSMSLNMQSKLLRTLQNKTYRKIGSQKEYPFEARIITASNDDLSKLIETKLFRSDFYYRISTITLDLPNLPERKDDIPLLTEHFISKFNKKYMKRVDGVSLRVQSVLMNYHWVGNIRELENVIEYAFALIPDHTEIIEFDHLPAYIQMHTNHLMDKPIEIIKKYQEPVDFGAPLGTTLGAYEKWLLLNHLDINNWNISKTAEILNLRRQSLQYRIKKYDLSKN
ncbi:AAA family ATPase [Acidaminobacter sp. JC074]|uniref:sigma-54 interaction domain-containing protein n=1 Tax=Acidaminobacter sp. JC074 TaxID=2530199 RepID=UPI001F10A7DC|nr:sigma 54-interacting transcriptional regulator [Acidaminobacter sp. JC074]MCH4887828.1 AAA family ATPase [Acidaminobacter sp. JC074]